jgi:hypothetical protein
VAGLRGRAAGPTAPVRTALLVAACVLGLAGAGAAPAMARDGCTATSGRDWRDGPGGDGRGDGQCVAQVPAQAAAATPAPTAPALAAPTPPAAASPIAQAVRPPVQSPEDTLADRAMAAAVVAAAVLILLLIAAGFRARRRLAVEV